MYTTTINTIGLSLDIVGVIIIFFNGPPVYHVLPDGREFLWTDSDEKGSKTARRKWRCAKFALFLILLGFVIQLVSNYLP